MLSSFIINYKKKKTYELNRSIKWILTIILRLVNYNMGKLSWFFYILVVFIFTFYVLKNYSLHPIFYCVRNNLHKKSSYSLFYFTLIKDVNYNFSVFYTY
jgi:hypothetical protein